MGPTEGQAPRLRLSLPQPLPCAPPCLLLLVWAEPLIPGLHGEWRAGAGQTPTVWEQPMGHSVASPGWALVPTVFLSGPRATSRCSLRGSQVSLSWQRDSCYYHLAGSIINLKGSWGETVEKLFIFKALNTIHFLSRVELCSGVLFLVPI